MRKILLGLFMVVAMVSCQKQYDTGLIPANADMVMSIDIASLAEEAGFSESSAIEFAKRYLKLNTMEIGINFTEPALVFELADGTVGALFSIYDEEALSDFLTEYAKEDMATLPKTSGDLTMSKIYNLVQVAYNDEMLLALYTNGQSDSKVKRQMQAMFDIKYEDSFFATEAYEKMEEIQSNDVVLYTTMSSLPETIKNYYKSILPSNVKSSDIRAISSFDSEEGQLVVESKIFSEKEDAQKMLDQHRDAFHKICGEYIDKVPQESVVTLMAGVEGEKIFSLIKGIPSLSQQITMLEMAADIDIEGKIKEAQGDVMFCMTDKEPLCITANNEQTVLLNGWKQGEVEELPIGKDELEDYTLFAFIDLEKVNKQQYIGYIPIPSVYKCANDLNSITISSKGENDITIKVISNNKGNFIKQLFE